MTYDINSKNTIVLIGNVGQDVDFNNLKEGRRVANLNVATNEGYTTENGDRVEKAVWHSVAAFGPLAERIEKSGIKAGSKVYVEGRMSYDDREVEKDGVKHVYHNAVVIVEQVINLTPKAAE